MGELGGRVEILGSDIAGVACRLGERVLLGIRTSVTQDYSAWAWA
jgi:hypothetical protein